MAFGRNTEYTRQLEEAQERCRTEHEPYIPLAQEIGHRIAEQTLVRSGVGIDTIIDTIVTDMSKAESRKLLLEEFHRLPVDARLQALMKAFPEEEARDALSPEIEHYRNRSEERRTIDRLVEIGRDYRYVPFDKIPKGSRMDLTFFTLADYEKCGSMAELSGSYDWARYVRLSSLGGNKFQVLEDSVNDDNHAQKPFLEIHEVIQVGSYVTEKNKGTIDYKGHWGSSLSVTRNGKIRDFSIKDEYEDERVELVLGEVEVNDIHVLGGQNC